MTTQNFFALLGDNENDDPAALIARYSASAAAAVAAEVKSQSKKVQPPARAQQAPANLPSKPLPPAEFVREAQRAQVRGGRGGGRGGRGGGFGERNHDREESYPRGGENGFSSARKNSNLIHSDNNEQRDGGNQGYQRGRGGYRGGGRVGSYAGYGEAPISQEKQESGRDLEGGRGRGRGSGRGRGRGFSRDEDDQSREREYDRRSGSGRGYEVKREGAGRFNWGSESDQQPLKEDLSEVSTSKEENHETQMEQKVEEPMKVETSDENGQQKAQEEEDKEMTLDEYEKVLEEKRKALAALKSQERRVDVDKSFQTMQLMDRKSEEDIFIKLNLDKEKGKKKEVAEKEDRTKKAVSINEFLKPADGETYYGAGNGRGRGRGRGRGGLRGSIFSPGQVSAPRIEDPGQFPTLGAN
ncbi:hypothetical protein O6H91_08G102200 [Diphasiastrum complanatum]|uniref:Uncharacterized protein n=1 Tax=Diphasiastrum complanatum TaxID=34168 RepID=A0ACC2D0Q7_DIPCM|nr:hypothetical protein O6H91_Y004900 [Diphasiastrum complanatum]KAJ7547749.1 hypothetical protein O6H91_08G102200 [Diphasiastrum complanatum]